MMFCAWTALLGTLPRMHTGKADPAAVHPKVKGVIKWGVKHGTSDSEVLHEVYRPKAGHALF